MCCIRKKRYSIWEKEKMRLIIDGQIGEEDLVVFARILREMWRHRKDKLFVFIEHGTENMTSDECMELFRQIFTKSDKDWKEDKMTIKMYIEIKQEEIKNGNNL